MTIAAVGGAGGGGAIPALRDYQERAIDALRPVARQRPIIVIPTGGGKTHVAAEIIRRTTERGVPALFLAHRRELIDQAIARLAAFGIHAGTIQASRPTRASLVQVASVQTLVRRDPPEAGLVIVDEVHHVRNNSQYAQILVHYPPPALVIGLTATPFRLDGHGLGSAGFGAIVAPVTVRELCNLGVILAPRVFAPGGEPPSLRGVRVTCGDYAPGALSERLNTRELTGRIVEHWQAHAAGHRTIAFACTIEHSRSIAARFLEAGIAAEHVDGGTPADQRTAIFARLASGETSVVSNVGIATEGWDLPTLEVAILARPTKSLCLHLQTIGRIMRATPGKTSCLVLDHAGNHLIHGMVTDEIEYSLEDAPRRKHALGLRTCPVCYAIFEGDTCPNCGHLELDTSKARKPIEETDESLVEFSQEDRIAQYMRLVAFASSRCLKIGWARHKYRDRFGVWPRHPGVEQTYRCRGHSFVAREHGVRCEWCGAREKEQRGVAHEAI